MATTSTVQALRPVRGSDALGNMFELVTRALNVAYYEWLPGPDELYLSPTLLEMFGYEAEPGTWQLDWDALHPDDQADHRKAWAAYLDGDATAAEFVYRASTASGEYRWWRNQSTVERNAAGKVTRVVGAVSDITEAKRSDAALTAAKRALEARGADVLEAISAALDVLKAMSTSPHDVRPIFDLIAERAQAFCEADGVAVALLHDSMLHLMTHRGLPGEIGRALEASYPRPLSTATPFGRAMMSRGVVMISNTRTDLEYGLDALTDEVSGAMLTVPMMRGGKSVGAIALGRRQPGDYSAAQVALMQTFAEQAVIAVSNAEMHHALQAHVAQARGTEF